MEEAYHSFAFLQQVKHDESLQQLGPTYMFEFYRATKYEVGAVQDENNHQGSLASSSPMYGLTLVT